MSNKEIGRWRQGEKKGKARNDEKVTGEGKEKGGRRIHVNEGKGMGDKKRRQEGKMRK